MTYLWETLIHCVSILRHDTRIVCCSINAMSRSGILHRLEDQALKTSQEIQPSTKAIDMPAILPIFVILIFGIFVATLIIVFEKIHYQIFKRKFD